MTYTRQPSLFITHGGGPCFWMDYPSPFDKNSFTELRDYLSGLTGRLPQRPKAIVVISAHWETPVPTINVSEAPPMLYDYIGFPAFAYLLHYPASGSPEVAKRVKNLLEYSGFRVALNTTRGFDHGIFVPFLILDPDAKIPVVMLSLQHNLDPAQHIAMGKALEPLRDENILIIGSGNSFHNLSELFSSDESESSIQFDDWLNETMTASDIVMRNQALVEWKQAPCALLCHPRAEHLLPLMVAAGAGGRDVGVRTLSTRPGGKAGSCFAFGELASV